MSGGRDDRVYTYSLLVREGRRLEVRLRHGEFPGVGVFAAGFNGLQVIGTGFGGDGVPPAPLRRLEGRSPFVEPEDEARAGAGVLVGFIRVVVEAVRPGAQLVVRTVLNAGAVEDGEGISVGEDQFYALRRQGKGPYFSDRLVAAPDDAAVALLRKTACQLVVAAVGDDGVLPAQGGEFVILPNLVNYIAYRATAGARRGETRTMLPFPASREMHRL